MFCKMLNEGAYKWALDNVNANTKSRFDKVGQTMTFADDVQHDSGPTWLNSGVS